MKIGLSARAARLRKEGKTGIFRKKPKPGHKCAKVLGKYDVDVGGVCEITVNFSGF